MRKIIFSLVALFLIVSFSLISVPSAEALQKVKGYTTKKGTYVAPDFKSSITIVDWNVKDIVSKAKKLLNDPNTYEGMKIQGLAVARQFDKRAMIKNYADKIKQL